MNALLVDFVRRWWWVLLAGVLVGVGSVFAGMPLIAAPMGGVLLLVDAQRGGMRVMRCLPLRTEDQGLFCWIVTVVLVPVLCLAVMLPAVLLRELFLPPSPYLWFRLGVQAWVALGVAAFILILIIFLPTQPGETVKEKLAGTIAGALWGLSLAGFIFVFPNLPRSPHAIATWHWVLIAGVPIALMGSVALRMEFLLRRSASGGSAAPRRAIEVPWQSGTPGLAGLPLFLATVPARAVWITFMVFVFQLLFLSLFLREQGGDVGNLVSMGAIQTGTMGIMFASFTAMWVNVRALRVLPLSHRALAALLLSPALGVGLLTALFAGIPRWLGSTRPVPLQAWEAGMLVFGFAAVGLSMMIRYPKLGVLLVIAMLSGATPLVMFLASRAYSHTFWVGLLGGALAIAGYFFITHVLKRASAAYRAPVAFGLGNYFQQGR